MEDGDILGHENMDEVIELGSEVTNLKVGDRVETDLAGSRTSRSRSVSAK
jgi:D-arabinose 1-dehydrogenase-like Zn-dependent alcohol dehydrogenase